MLMQSLHAFLCNLPHRAEVFVYDRYYSKCGKPISTSATAMYLPSGLNRIPFPEYFGPEMYRKVLSASDHMVILQINIVTQSGLCM